MYVERKVITIVGKRGLSILKQQVRGDKKLLISMLWTETPRNMINQVTGFLTLYLW